MGDTNLGDKYIQMIIMHVLDINMPFSLVAYLHKMAICVYDFLFGLRPCPSMLRIYPGICAQGSLLGGLGIPRGVRV